MQAESTKQIKTSDLEGEALDWAVWKIEHSNAKTDDELIAALSPFNPSSNWAQADPIIDREKIATSPAFNGSSWVADMPLAPTSRQCASFGQTRLVAAMRCYVASKLGDVVEVPCELVLTGN